MTQAASPSAKPPAARRVAPHPAGLLLSSPSGDEEVLPLYAGAMHYWRHAPDRWGALEGE